MWEKLTEGMRWLAAAFPQIPTASVKTERFEIKGATAGEVVRIIRELREDAKPRRVRRLGGRTRGTRSAHHSERPDRRP